MARYFYNGSFSYFHRFYRMVSCFYFWNELEGDSHFENHQRFLVMIMWFSFLRIVVILEILLNNQSIPFRLPKPYFFDKYVLLIFPTLVLKYSILWFKLPFKELSDLVYLVVLVTWQCRPYHILYNDQPILLDYQIAWRHQSHFRPVDPIGIYYLVFC